MNDKQERNGFQPDTRQLVLGPIMGVALSIIFAVALGSWIYALLGFATGFFIYASVPLVRR